jgi:CheY-like chemotaxis protein
MQAKRLLVNDINSGFVRDDSIITTSGGLWKEKLDSHHPLRILVVDDSIPIVKMTSLALRKDGHTVSAAENGVAALELFSEKWMKVCTEETDPAVFKYCPHRPFDVVLMDFQMPVMDGVTAIRELRAAENKIPPFGQDHFQNMIIIGFSAKSDEDQVDAAYSNGMDAFLPKPFTIAAFHSILANF